MGDDEAISICRRWLAYLDEQKAKSQRLQELSAQARQGPSQAAKAQRELRQIDRQPRVFDGATLEPAIRHLVKRHEGSPSNDEILRKLAEIYLLKSAEKERNDLRAENERLRTLTAIRYDTDN